MIGIAILLAATAATVTYDCEVARPTSALRYVGQEPIPTPLALDGIAPGPWKFRIELSEQPKLSVSVNWPGDPLQVAGGYPAFRTAKGAVTFVALRNPPCMFSDDACLAAVHLVDQSSTSAKVVIYPVALTDGEAKGSLAPFSMNISGNCSRTASAQ